MLQLLLLGAFARILCGLSLQAEADRYRESTANTMQYIVYSVGVGHFDVSKIEAILDTWGSELEAGSLQFTGLSFADFTQKTFRNASDVQGVRFVATTGPNHQLSAHFKCRDDHAGGACKDAVGLKAAYDAGAQWVVLLGPDNYVFPRVVEERLQRYDHAQPHVLGIKGCGKCDGGGLCGGGGQLVSRGAVEKMLEPGFETYLKEQQCEGRTGSGVFGDIATCRVAFKRGFKVEQMAGLYAWRKSEKEVAALFDKCAEYCATPKAAAARCPMVLHYVTVQHMLKLRTVDKKYEGGKCRAEPRGAKLNARRLSLDGVLASGVLNVEYTKERDRYVEAVNTERSATRLSRRSEELLSDC